MLERIILRNFQCHARTDIDFGQITTICGRSDAGKSSTLRALRFLSQNLPSGSAFVRHGRVRCRVRLQVDGKSVTRVKGEKENTYLLDAEEFKALGQGPQGVPSAVARVLQTDDINFQLQHDAPFWFADTPGQVSKALNRIVNLDVIDRTLAKAASAVRQAQAVEEVTTARVKEAEEAVKKLEWVKDFDAALSAVISARDRHTEVDNRVERLTGLLKAHRAEVERGKSRVGDFDPVEDAKVEGDKAADECGRLEWLVDQYDRAMETLCQQRSEQKEAEKKLGDRCPTCGQNLKSSASSRPTCTYPKRPR